MEPTNQNLLFTIEDVCAYYEQFRPAQMENFARFVISKGYGAITPYGRRQSGSGKMERETWQACGRRLFGERFIPVMERALETHRATLTVPAPAILATIPDPEF